VATRRPDTLIVNQTFLGGWRRVDRKAPLFDRAGRLATEVLPEDGSVRLEYRPRLLLPGALLSAAGALVALGLLAWSRARGSPRPK
jgi:hypothetical protein